LLRKCIQHRELIVELDFDDEWSDEETAPGSKDTQTELAAAQAAIKQLQSLVQTLTNETEVEKPSRDDDTHYFGSYEENGTPPA
jgi:hypothetical protein